MILSKAALSQILKNPRDKKLEEAEKYESRLSMHGSSTMSAPEGQAFKDFIKNYPEKLLPKDKATKFKNLLTYPLITVSIVDELFKDLWKVFDAQNKVENIIFETPELAKDFQDYRAKIKEPEYWESFGWKLVKTAPNSVMIIDLSINQKTEAPEPMYYTTPISNVRAIKEMATKDGLEYLIINGAITGEEKQTGIIEKFYVYDDLSYRMITRKSNSDNYIFEIDSPHDLGSCPARYFWTDEVKDGLKSSPFGNELGNLDWILYESTTLRHLELYAGYPIITAYQEACSYMSESGAHCEGGFTKEESEHNGEIVYLNKECPNCASRDLIGAGSIREVPAPIDKDSADLMPSVEITKGDTDSLEWFEGNVTKRIQEIKARVTGSGGEPVNDQAKNIKQIDSGFEKKQTILSSIARNLENIQQFTINTIAKLRYGKDFNQSIISYGNKFFLQTEKETLEAYKQAKDDGLPNYMLEDMRKQMIQKKYRNDPVMLKRAILLDFLEPLPDYSVLNIIGVATIDPKVVFRKMNFNDLIKRFEIENGNIVLFMKDLDIEIRVAKIDEILNKYVKETFVEPPKEIQKETNTQI